MILSNQLEVLADALRDKLVTGSPLKKRWVVVPTHFLKNYLLCKYAKDPSMQVCAGVTILTLAQAIDQLLFQQGSALRVIKPLELVLAIQEQILLLQPEDEQMRPLMEYIAGKKSHAISDFAKELESFFLAQSVQEQSLLKQWREEKKWQQTLFNRIFNTRWLLPYELEHINFDFQGQLHLIGFHFLPLPYLKLFQKLQAHFYLLSPCQMFWSDICSDKEVKFIRAKTDALDDYLLDRNTLLANLGKLGREFLKLIDRIEMPTEERYEEKQATHLLGSIQNDLLTMRATEGIANLQFAPKDESIQVHKASSLLREVEILHDNLATLFRREVYQPQDILVFAPDICAYAPYIHMVFGAQKIDYCIHDLETSSHNAFVRGLFDLLTLSTKRFELSAFLKLFNTSCFLEKFGITQEQVALIHEWLKEAKVSWGLSAEYRSAILQTPQNGIGSWEYGFDRLSLGLAQKKDAEHQGIFALGCVQLQDAELLGILIFIVRSLAADLKPLYCNHKMSLACWIEWIKELSSTYFILSSEERSLIEELQSAIAAFATSEALFEFASVQQLLESVLNKKNGKFNPSHLNAVTFSSLKEGSAIPSKVIYLLGMQEESFPRKTRSSSICNPSCCYIPKAADEDRYLFLELLLSAQDYFIMSYQKASSQDGKEQSASLVIQELLSYVDSAYSNKPSSSLVYEHATLPFVLKKQTCKAPSYFIPEFYELTSKPLLEQAEYIVNVKELKAFARHPIEFYCQSVLKLPIKTWPSEELYEKELLFSARDRASLRSESLHMLPQELIKKAEAKAQLPVGLFKELATWQLTQDIQEYTSYLTDCCINKEQIFSVEWKMGCYAPEEVSKGNYILPALRIALTQTNVAVVVGKLSDLTQEGLLFHGEDSLKDLVRIWPSLLLFLNLPASFGCAPKLLLTKEKKTKEFLLSSSLECLRRYLHYYTLCLTQISPLMPSWMAAFLKKDKEALNKAIRSSLSSQGGYPDEVLNWLFLHQPLPSAEVLINNWSDDALALFEGGITP